MYQPLLFHPPEEDPLHLIVQAGVILTTGSRYDEEGRWTRFVQGNYHPNLGFLTSDGRERIQFFVTLLNLDTFERRFMEDYPSSFIADQINPFIPEKTLTAIHYCPGSRIYSLRVGLDPETEHLLPKHFLYPYP